MTRMWTREERRKHIRKKYFRWKHKIFATVLAVIIVLATLYVTINSFTGSVPLQLVSGLLAVVTVLMGFMLVWGGATLKSTVSVLSILVIVLAILITAWSTGLGVIEQLIVSVIMSAILLVVIAAMVFFVDLATYENE